MLYVSLGTINVFLRRNFDHLIYNRFNNSQFFLLCSSVQTLSDADLFTLYKLFL